MTLAYREGKFRYGYRFWRPCEAGSTADLNGMMGVVTGSEESSGTHFLSINFFNDNILDLKRKPEHHRVVEDADKRFQYL